MSGSTWSDSTTFWRPKQVMLTSLSYYCYMGLMQMHRTSRDRVPLHLACWHGQKEAVQTLINRGASKNVVTVDGQTPDQFASERGFYGILSTLRQHRQSLSLYAPEQLKTFEMFRNRTAPTRLASLCHEECESDEVSYQICQTYNK